MIVSALDDFVQQVDKSGDAASAGPMSLAVALKRSGGHAQSITSETLVYPGYSVSIGDAFLLVVGFLQPVHQARLRNSEVFHDLVQRGFVLPGDRYNITPKLGWVGLGRDDIFPVKTNHHRSGVNQTGGSPPPSKNCCGVSDCRGSSRVRARQCLSG